MITFIFLTYLCCSVNAISSYIGRRTIDIIDGQPVELERDGYQMTVSLCELNCKVNNITFSSSLMKSNGFLDDIQTLHVTDVVWSLEPKFRNLSEAYFDSATIVGRWADCAKLERLSLKECNLSMITIDWLSNCLNLHSIIVREVDASKLSTVIQSATYITYLEVLNLYGMHHIVQVPLFTASAHRFLDTVKLLEFATSWVESSPENTNWTEVSAALSWQLSLLPALEQLTFLNLEKLTFCSPGSREAFFSSLKRLHYYYSKIESLLILENCFMPLLETIHFYQYASDPPTVNIEFSSLIKILRSRPPQLTRDLGIYSTLQITRNSASQSYNVTFSRNDYMTLLKIYSDTEGAKIFFYNDVLNGKSKLFFECADIFWLVKALRENLIITENFILECRNGTSIDELLIYEHIDCKRYPANAVEYVPCLCCWAGDELVADCRGVGLSALPDNLLNLQNLTKLLAPNNSISALPKMLPNRLKLLDLSRNNIRDLNRPALFAIKDVRWRLSGNPISCNCHNGPLLDMLRNRAQQIEDYDNTECVNGYRFKALSETCESQKLNVSLENVKQIKEDEARLANKREKELNIIIISAVLVLLVALVMLAIAVYYRKTIQMILFSRGWCLCFMRKEASDEDRLYDIFLSFCHEDTELVLGQLLPKLDQDYTVCMHMRNWIPGEMIPENIRKSVKASKRTMVILSKNFTKSIWSNMEFETAYAASMDERRARIIMVILDDVLESEDLNKDMRLYVRLNTYLRWGDPWFWSQLRYALPQTREATQQQPAGSVQLALDDAAGTEGAVTEQTPPSNLASSEAMFSDNNNEVEVVEDQAQ